MDADFINSYLDRAKEIIGHRSDAEIRYDDAVVEQLQKGGNIQDAIAAANRQYPGDALRPDATHWHDLQARYEYIMEHKKILARLGMKE